MKSEIVDSEVKSHYRNIPNKLTPTLQVRLVESDILVKPETSEESDRKDYAECSDMRRDCNLKIRGFKDLKIYYFMPYNEVVNNEVKHPVETHITSSTSTITEELLRAYLSERAIEEIYYFSDKTR